MRRVTKYSRFRCVRAPTTGGLSNNGPCHSLDRHSLSKPASSAQPSQPRETWGVAWRAIHPAQTRGQLAKQSIMFVDLSRESDPVEAHRSNFMHDILTEVRADVLRIKQICVRAKPWIKIYLVFVLVFFLRSQCKHDTIPVQAGFAFRKHKQNININSIFISIAYVFPTYPYERTWGPCTATHPRVQTTGSMFKRDPRELMGHSQGGGSTKGRPRLPRMDVATLSTIWHLNSRT